MEPPLVLTREQVRRVDAIAVERDGMSSLVLMENAGRGVVDVLLERDSALLTNFFPAPSPLRGGDQPSTGDPKSPERRAVVLAQRPGRGSATEGITAPPHTPPPSPARRGEGSGRDVVILCGKGNNAGDGFVIARHLEIRGVWAKALLLCSPDELTGDARKNYEILTHTGVPIVDASAGPLAARLDEHAGDSAWLVDAMLGTGAQGEPRAPFAAAIEWMNAQDSRRLAVDIPSGLDCDTGAPASATVRADVTCTFVAMKPGFLTPQAQPFLGHVHVVSIGVPPRLVREAAGA